jgi:hypothetical protein
MLYPFKVCKFFDSRVPCPNEYIDLLRGYNNEKYNKGSLAYPDTYSINTFALSWWTNYVNMTGPEPPLTGEEIYDLKVYAKHLHDNGFASFHELLQDNNEYEKYKALAYNNNTGLTQTRIPRIPHKTPTSNKKTTKGRRRSSQNKK